jgi:type IV pilus assembly protein PilQ
MDRYKKTKTRYRDCTIALLIISFLILPVTIATGQNISKAAKEKLQTRITYSCVNLPIETVLMNLAEQANIDIVKSPKVTGNVTVKVTEVPLEEALTNILAAHDYTYVTTESMVRVVPLPEIATAREPLVTRIYQITYADANDVAKALGNYISNRGNLALNKGTSHIIVTDTENKIKGIDKFIEQIDYATPQLLVEVRLYDITATEGFELGTEWTVGRNVTTHIETDLPLGTTNTTTFTETTSGVYRDSDDGPANSFTVEGTTEETTELPLGAFLARTPEQLKEFTTRRRKPFVGGSFDRLEGGTLNFSLLNDAVDLEFALNVLHKQVEAKLLANPRILVLDNETANFEIIREIPYRELMQVAREDPITYTAFKNVGVHLKVTPHIARDEMVKLHIEPEFGVLVGLNAEGTPTVDTRRANTVTMIKDGQTIAFGGLKQNKTTKDIAKVPLLGDLPLIGGLFRSETESVETSELVLFITTTIITEPALSQIEQRQFEATEFAIPELSKTRLESRELKTKAKESEVPEIKELLDMMLQDMEK